MSGLNFGLLGAAAYVAPRHMRAIQETGNNLIAALDPYDNVGILDSFAPQCQFFTEFERFDRHVSKLRRRGEGLDWLSVCTPNYLHDSHCMTGLRLGANVICEKPLVLSPANLDELQEAERENDKRIYVVMQLRFHEAIQKLKTSLDPSKIYDIDLTYITGRGPWFFHSWKGQDWSSGGLIFNIGIHFLDMLTWLFGSVVSVEVHVKDDSRVAGFFQLERARVRWFLSTDAQFLPDETGDNIRTYRSLTINGEEIEFSGGFADLHTTVYRMALSGFGTTIEDVRPSIELAHAVRTADLSCAAKEENIHGLALWSSCNAA